MPQTRNRKKRERHKRRLERNRHRLYRQALKAFEPQREAYRRAWLRAQQLHIMEIDC
jgi:hypothetical protein